NLDTSHMTVYPKRPNQRHINLEQRRRPPYLTNRREVKEKQKIKQFESNKELNLQTRKVTAKSQSMKIEESGPKDNIPQ
ncbi:8002_t:CDS:2, partial [Acaulospora morrowiae]